jgi:hypothetical protein
MKRTVLVAAWLLLVVTAGWAQDDPAQLGVRLRAAVAGYQGLIKALDLGSLPTDAPDYRLVSNNVQDLGERLEALSRLALQTEAAAQPDWPALAAAVQLFQGDLQQLRRQSLPLRIWAFAKTHGQKQPVWGAAVSHSPDPLPQAKGACDGEVDETLELTVTPGGETMVQIIALPLQGGLRRVRARIGTLKGPAGKLPETGVSLRPVDYARLDPPAGEPWWRHATYDGAPDVPEGLSQAFVLLVSAPAEAAAGDYEADLRLDPEGAKTVELAVTITVPTP